MRSLQADFEKVVTGDVHTFSTHGFAAMGSKPPPILDLLRRHDSKGQEEEEEDNEFYDVSPSFNIQGPTVQVSNFGLPIVSYQIVSWRVRSALVAQIA